MPSERLQTRLSHLNDVCPFILLAIDSSAKQIAGESLAFHRSSASFSMSRMSSSMVFSSSLDLTALKRSSFLYASGG